MEGDWNYNTEVDHSRPDQDKSERLNKGIQKNLRGGSCDSPKYKYQQTGKEQCSWNNNHSHTTKRGFGGLVHGQKNKEMNLYPFCIETTGIT